MIYKRVAARLRAQDWLAITIELAIVVVGVFIGTWVANWNQARSERRVTAQMLTELQPGLRHFIGFFDTAKPYYRTTRAFADTAFAGWRGDPKVSDDQFVIAAYQASQVYGLEINAVNWAKIFGSDQLRSIDDPAVRRGLASPMSVDFADVAPNAVRTPYREQVRKVIPEDIQNLIRDGCGDRPLPDDPQLAFLPERCAIDLPARRWADAAAQLRAKPELVGELRWHLAAIATFLFNMSKIDQSTLDLSAAIGDADAGR